MLRLKPSQIVQIEGSDPTGFPFLFMSLEFLLSKLPGRGIVGL